MRTQPSILLLLLPLLIACPTGGGIIAPPPDDDDTLFDDDDAGDDDAGDDDDSTADDDDAGDDDDAVVIPASVVVNELMSVNGGSVLNDLGEISDWVELHNPGDEPLELGGYGMSDDWAYPGWHELPESLVLPAHGYLLLWADGNAGAGGTHLPFRLAAEGEGVGIWSPAGESLDWIVFEPLPADMAFARIPDAGEEWVLMEHGTPGWANAVVEEVVIEVVEAGSTWSYYDDEDEPDGDWRQPSFDDSGWETGPAPLGYSDSPATTIDYGSDSSDKNPTALFRHTFELDAGLENAGGEISIRVDDGAVVYLGGTEVLRRNLPDGSIEWDTYAEYAVSGDGETEWNEYDLPAGVLVAGENVLAIEVHQATPGSSDMVIDLSLELQAWQ